MKRNLLIAAGFISVLAVIGIKLLIGIHHNGDYVLVIGSRDILRGMAVAIVAPLLILASRGEKS